MREQVAEQQIREPAMRQLLLRSGLKSSYCCAAAACLTAEAAPKSVPVINVAAWSFLGTSHSRVATHHTRLQLNCCFHGDSGGLQVKVGQAAACQQSAKQVKKST